MPGVPPDQNTVESHEREVTRGSSLCFGPPPDGRSSRLCARPAPAVAGFSLGKGRDARAKPRYANKRAEIWGSVKDWLEKGSLPDDPELAADLTGVEYGFNARGEIQLEKKDDMKKRGLASPDIADALALTFALPVTAGWDAPPVQAYCVTEYDLYRDFTEEYWDEKDEFDE